MVLNLSEFLKCLVSNLELNFSDNFTGLVLFGSYAKGTQTNSSDIDILLTFKALPNSRFERIKLFNDLVLDLESKFAVKVSLLLKTETELLKNNFMFDIGVYSKIVVDKSKKLLSFFNSIKKDYSKGKVKKVLFNLNDYFVRVYG